MLISMLLLVDAEICRRLFLYGPSMGWVIPGGTGPASHKPTLFALVDAVIFSLLFVIHLGLGWFVWQIWRGKKPGESRLLHLLLGDDRIVWTEKSLHEFQFTSTLGGILMAKSWGVALIYISADFVEGWLHPSWSRLPYLILLLPFPLFLWAAAGMFLVASCQIQILQGQFGFRRLFTWRAVPLTSISRVKLRWFGIDVTVDHEGKRHRLFFNSEDHTIGSSPPPVVQFLREVCKQNQESRQSRG